MDLSPYKGAGKPSCTKAVTLYYAGANVHMKQGGFILVNGKEVSALPVMVGDVRIRAASSMFVIGKTNGIWSVWMLCLIVLALSKDLSDNILKIILSCKMKIDEKSATNIKLNFF